MRTADGSRAHGAHHGATVMRAGRLRVALSRTITITVLIKPYAAKRNLYFAGRLSFSYR